MTYFVLVKKFCQEPDVFELSLGDAEHLFHECQPWVDQGFLEYVEVWDSSKDTAILEYSLDMYL